jgi:hypothetical protein
MNQPELLFAYRKVFFEDQWHLKCINCGPSPEGDWDWPMTWQLFTSTGTSISISLPPQSCETTGIPLGPDEVYGVDQAIMNLNTTSGIHAMLAQNIAAVVTDDDLSRTELPLFLSASPPKCYCASLIVRFESKFMTLLPEVRAYENRLKIHSEDSDLVMFRPPTSPQASIPTGLFLPGMIESEATQTPIVYSIVNWQSGTMAIVECFAFDDVEFKRQSVIKRDADNFLGSVVGLSRSSRKGNGSMPAE